MMRVYATGIGWYSTRCDKHPEADLGSDSASRTIQYAQRHNVAMHPRRARRDLRRFIR
jgi:hypothetical protein